MVQVRSDIQIDLPQGSLSAIMEGSGEPESGYLDVNITLGEEPPFGFDPVVLAAFTLTGMIRFAKRIGTAQNLCAVTSGEYFGMRDLIFDQGGQLTSSIRVQRRGDQLHADLKIWGSVQLPDLLDVSGPFQEKFEPVGPGRIDGTFPIAFLAVDGAIVGATAHTHYMLNTTQTLPCEHFRNILLTMNRDSSKLRQREKIVLFDDKSAANRHLGLLHGDAPLETRFALAEAA